MNEPYTDDDLFPFGTHKNKKFKDVPASYFDWVQDQEWLSKWPRVKEYMTRNWSAIEKELEESKYKK